LNPLFIAFISMSAGAIIGGFAAFQLGSGVGANAGVTKGFSDGACSAMEAAKARGLVTAEQYDEVLNAAAQIAGRAEVQSDARLSDTAAKCEQVIANLQQAKVK
jgi:hypothetical protein